MYLDCYLKLYFSLLHEHIAYIWLSRVKSSMQNIQAPCHVPDASRRAIQTSGCWVGHSDLLLQGALCILWNYRGIAKCFICS